MSNPFAAFCDDFYVNMRLGSQLTLPHQRETLLHFFERIQKNFPNMSKFRKTDSGDFNNTDSVQNAHGSTPWLVIHCSRACAFASGIQCSTPNRRVKTMLTIHHPRYRRTFSAASTSSSA